MLAKPALSQDHAEWLEAVRRIPCEIAAAHGVVSIDGNLAFEYRQSGELRYRKLRIVNRDGSKTFRRDRSGAETCLFNVDCLDEPLATPDTPLVICEGEIDALSWITAGMTHVVSVPDGAQRREPGEGDIDPRADDGYSWLWDGGKLIQGLRNWQKIIIATDADRPGNILRDELALRLGRERCWSVEYPEGCKDANEALVEHGEGVLIDAAIAARPLVPGRLVPMLAIPEPAELTVYTTGWGSGMDQHLRLAAPSLIPIVGPPGEGKSQFALALCAQLARLHGLKTAVMQFEDNPERNKRDLLRYAMAWASASSSGTPIAGPAERWVNEHFYAIAPPENLADEDDKTLGWVREQIESAALHHGCRIVLLDPWNEIEHAWSRHESEATYTNAALREIKRWARRWRLIVIIVAHPGKAIDGKSIDEMTLYDVAGSAAWKNKADHGIIIKRTNENSSQVYVKVDKSKDWETMGVPGIVRMEFDRRNATYRFVGSGL